MTIRTTLSHVARQAQMASSRATVREFDDDHLMQEITKADVYHNESPTEFERWQMVGMTAFPLKQEEDPKQKNAAQDKGEQGDWDHNQPTGPAAEALMLYLNGQRSHPVALVDDRRVRPYEMSEGEGAHYAPDGSEQMVLFKENGTYVVSLDNVSVKDKKNKKTRMTSLRHVNKKMQTHKIEKKKEDGAASGGGGPSAQQLEGSEGSSGGAGQQKKEKYKHEGDSVNTEVRVIKDRIEFYAPGDKKVGLYDKSAKRWFFDVDGAGSCTLEMLSDKITLKVGGSNIEITSGRIKLTSPRIDHN